MHVLRDHNSLSDQAVPFKKILQMATRIQVFFSQNCRLLNSLTDLPFRNGIYKEPINQHICLSLSLSLSQQTAASSASPLFLSRGRKQALSAMAGRLASRRRRRIDHRTSPAA